MARVTKLQQIKSGSKTVVLWDQWLAVKYLHIVLLTGTIYSVCLFPPGFNKQTEASDCFHSLRHFVTFVALQLQHIYASKQMSIYETCLLLQNV